jgi:MFS family permease
MATAQVVMVAVMTATPLAMHMGGHGLTDVGVVLSAHTLGMFALSPVTGWLADRFGPGPVMLGGLATLAAATTLAAVTGGLPWLRTAALFLLGYGWNLCFIGGSAHLARDLPVLDRARIEGAVDGGVWAAAAIASVVATALLAAGGYAVLSGTAGTLLVLPALVLTWRRRLPPQPTLRGLADDGIA